MLSDETVQRLTRVLHNAGLDLAEIESASAFVDLLRREPELQASSLTALSRLYGMPRFGASLEPESDALALVTEDSVRQSGVLPVSNQNGTVELAVTDPASIQGDDVNFVLGGAPVSAKLISIAQLDEVLADPGVKSAFKKTGAAKVSAPRAVQKNYRVDREQDVISFVEDVIRSAIELDASDIHVEPFRETARVRMRLSGVLVERVEYSDFLHAKYAAITSRFKILAGCDISERRKAQDGALVFSMPDGRDIDLRFNTVPTKHGERLVARVLAANPALALDKLGFSAQVLDQIQQVIYAPQGMVLVTGPTGSGKTTTLYGMLQEINDPMRNILTAEDPVEYYLEGAGQIQVNEKVGLSFAEVLRAFLRQDPDVILVGEIRDTETVEIAVKAALTGHLVLSTLHTNDAISTINRMVNLGIPGHMLGAALSMIIGQRLARKNCTSCLTDDAAAGPEVLTRLGLAADVRPKMGAGCEQCSDTGFSGRVGIYECLVVTDALSGKIAEGVSQRELLTQARAEGFCSMQDMGKEFIEQGVLSVSEFARTVQV